MTNFDAVKYFDNIARSSIYIKHTDNNIHFTVASGIMQLEGLLANLTQTKDFQLIALKETNGVYNNNHTVNLAETNHNSFVLAKNYKINDMDDYIYVENEIVMMGKKIFAKMRKDNLNAMKMPVKDDKIGLRQLQQASFRYFSIGNIADNYLAVQFSFITIQEDQTQFDSEEWDDFQS